MYVLQYRVALFDGADYSVQQYCSLALELVEWSIVYR